MGDKLSEKELSSLREKILEKAYCCKNKEEHKDNRQSQLWRTYSISTKIGKQVYISFTDIALLQYLREYSRIINHSPSQKEVYWVMREYIKKRFDKWPYALKKAGLSSSAGNGGKSVDRQTKENAHIKSLLEEVNRKSIQLGQIPHPKDLPEICQELRKYYKTWGQVVKDSGINPETLNKQVVYSIDDLEEYYEEMLYKIKLEAIKRGRGPQHNEVSREIKEKLIKRCGSWRNALYQVGLEPVIRMNPFAGIYIDHRKTGNRDKHSDVLYNSYYKVLNLSNDAENALKEIKKIYIKTGKIPDKKDIDENVRRLLQRECGSWANALYQIGIHYNKKL